MKELTSVLTVQFTYKCIYDDEKAEVALQVQETAAKRWIKALKEYSEAHDVQLLDDHVSVEEV